MKLCPWKFTDNFHKKLVTLFFVSNFSRQFDLIKAQFIAGQADHMEGNKYQVYVKDFPAIVTVVEGAVTNIKYVRG